MITINLYAERVFKNSFNMILNIHLVYCFFSFDDRKIGYIIQYSVELAKVTTSDSKN